MAKSAARGVAGLLLAAATAAHAGGPVVHTQYGSVMGGVDPQTNSTWFHSIPFAAPPVGKLRYAPPRPPTPWSGTLDATKSPNECPQMNLLGSFYSGDEDCLYLHVYIPPGHNPQTDEPLPVMLWIYGGGFIGGTSQTSKYDGAILAAKYNVVVVAPNYRLGPFGFMALPALAAEQANGTTGNYGPQDQTMAMRWTRDNIAAFGGDPTKVTIFGESAGGFSVCWHLQSPSSQGLFRAAIMESGSCDSPAFFVDMPRAVAWSLEMAAAVGCNGTSATSAEVVACLRAKPTVEVMVPMVRELGKHFPYGDDRTPAFLPPLAPFMPWGPAIDGAYEGCVGKPYDLFRKGLGHFNDVPVIFGTNLNEGSMFAPALTLIIHKLLDLPPTEADFEAAMDLLFGGGPTGINNASDVAMARRMSTEAYPASEFPNQWARGSRMITDMFFFCGTRRALLQLQSLGVKAWGYHFTFNDGTPEGKFFGVYHSSEVKYVFNEWAYEEGVSAANRTMMETFGTYWTNFAKYLDPNGPPAADDSGSSSGGMPMTPWPMIGSNTSSYRHLNITVPPSVERNMLQTKCALWDKLYPLINVYKP